MKVEKQKSKWGVGAFRRVGPRQLLAIIFLLAKDDDAMHNERFMIWLYTTIPRPSLSDPTNLRTLLIVMNRTYETVIQISPFPFQEQTNRLC